MTHRGEIVEQAVRKSGVPIATIAKRLGKSRRWMYLMFDNPDVPIEMIARIGQIIYYDFHEDLPALFPKGNTSDSPIIYKPSESAEYWKNKYLSLLEEHNALLKKLTSGT
ncbi:MAG: hypothetical protein J0G96_04925 [Flavobacteriia bacterium]|nr:hypothetical protein [Flavobacteriia bacterium]OJX35318.1 MAG: hypothetical protein BGO87_11985 [Flavobacteriia bacterium 40-80]